MGRLLIKFRYVILAVALAAIAVSAISFSAGEKDLAVNLTSNLSIEANGYSGEFKLMEPNGAVRVESVGIRGIGYERMIPGGTLLIDFSIEPENANEAVDWNSSDPNTVSVSSDGLVTAYKKGLSLVTVSTRDGKKSDRVIIEVVKKPDHILNVPYLTQIYDYPNGCESVSTVMALNYVGIDITVDEFIEKYLDMSPLPEMIDGELWGYSPWDYFVGDPRLYSGLCCYAPVIVNALEKFVDIEEYEILELYNVPIEDLCRDYIMNNVPVIFFGTMYMNTPYVPGWCWNVIDGEEGEVFYWTDPMHCLLLVGYDDGYYYFNDPTAGKQVAYSKSDTEAAYKGMFEQAVVVRKRTASE